MIFTMYQDGLHEVENATLSTEIVVWIRKVQRPSFFTVSKQPAGGQKQVLRERDYISVCSCNYCLYPLIVSWEIPCCCDNAVALKGLSFDYFSQKGIKGQFY